jgi:anti-sigma-K factor RskA
MEEMDRDRMNERLEPLWAEYRGACPDPEASAGFMPQMWQRIETRRNAISSSWFRVWAQVWLATAVTLTIVMGAIVIPRLQNAPLYEANYVDVLAAADSVADSASDGLAIPLGEPE